MQLQPGLGEELGAPVARSHASDHDAPTLGREVDSPLLESQRHPGVTLAYAPVRIRLRARLEGPCDGGSEIHASAPQPLELIPGEVRERHVPGRDGIRGRQPTRPRVRVCIGVSNVRLEVEDRRLVQKVEAAHVKDQALDPLESHHAQANRVGAMRRARGEHATFAIAAGRENFRLPTSSLLDVSMKDENDPDAIETVEAFERVLVAAAREKLDAADGVQRVARLPWSRGPLLERRTDDPDGLEKVRSAGGHERLRA
jgi:hypothetical protein